MINLAIRLSLRITKHYLLVAMLLIRALSDFSKKQIYPTFTNYFVHAMFLIFVLEVILYSKEGN